MNFQLDSDGDLLFSDSQVQFVTGQDEISQILEVRLKTILGEWFLDLSLGVPYFSKILKKNPIDSEVESAIITEISRSPGVLSVESLEMELSPERELSVTSRIVTTEGVLDFATEVA